MAPSVSTNSMAIASVPINTVVSLGSVKLNGENYFFWKSQIVPAMHSKDLFKFVDGSFPPPNEFLPAKPNARGDSLPKTNPAYRSWRRKDQLVLSWINATLTEYVLMQVVGRLTSKDVWEALEKMYSSRDSEVWLLKEQLNSLFKGNTPMSDYLNQVKGIRDALAAAEAPISDRDLVLSTLEGLPSDFKKRVVKKLGMYKPDFNKLAEVLLSVDCELEMRLNTALPPKVVYYLPLVKASVEGDWKTAQSIFNSDQKAFKIQFGDGGLTALSIAATSAQTKFMEKIVQLMQPDDLELRGERGFTALHCIATNGNTKAAKILVTKNSRLTQIRNIYDETPLLRATRFGHKNLVWYLCSVTKDENPSPFRGEDGASLLMSTLKSDLYDVALHLLRLYPEMAITQYDGSSAIDVLAAKSWLPKSGGWVGSWNLYTDSLPSMKNHYDTKIMHGQYLKVVTCVCDQIALLDDSKKKDLMDEAALLAAEHGNVELIKSILKFDPDSLFAHTSQGHTMLHFAVKYRQEEVFNYLKSLGFKDQWAGISDDDSGDNILHLAASLAPASTLNFISGAALQVQHELQWYKEVEKIVQPAFRINTNNKSHSPKVRFTEEHKELVEKGEKWMKDMASSSMVVATLIATVVFAAAFTVPGGNKNDIGIPVFLKTQSYMVFAVSNALAFCSSLTSVLMFLSILTARYAEEDFLRSLPQKLIIGLGTLFFAIATMIVAFSATYFIMLGQKLAWLSVLITSLTCLPVTLYAFLQYPLFNEIIHSTYKCSL